MSVDMQAAAPPDTQAGVDSGQAGAATQLAPVAAPAAAAPPSPPASRQLPDPTRPQTAPAGPGPGSIADGVLTVSQPWGARAQALQVPSSAKPASPPPVSAAATAAVLSSFLVEVESLLRPHSLLTFSFEAVFAHFLLLSFIC